MSISPYRVSAYNTAKASENKIHDDATAQRFGFKGGFVGGVNVYAYMSHQPVQRWGRAWLERGTGEAKFAKPVYENSIAEVTAVEDADGLELAVHSEGILCATGRAALPADLPPAPALSDFKAVAPRTDRVQADETSLQNRRLAGHDATADHRIVPCPGPAGHPRNRSNIRSGSYRSYRHHHALLQLGADPQRYFAGMDSHGQHGAQPGHRPCRRHAERAGQDHEELRAQGPQMGGDRCHGRCQ